MKKEGPKYAKIDSKLKKKWLAALRSGKYRQTRKGQLKHKGAYCCLGVLCEVAGVPVTWDEEEDPPVYIEEVDGVREMKLLPAFCESGDTTQEKLSELNDRAHYSFKKIADWIEENL